MGDGRAKRGLGGARGVDMNELMVAGGVSDWLIGLIHGEQAALAGRAGRIGILRHCLAHIPPPLSAFSWCSE